MYIAVGVIGVATSALFYNYLENVLAKQYNRITVANALAWRHLVLMNVGTTVQYLLMYAGYFSIAAILPPIT